jgi:hypothetical protein
MTGGLLSDETDDEPADLTNKNKDMDKDELTPFKSMQKQQELSYLLGLILNRIEYVDELSDEHELIIDETAHVERSILVQRRQARLVDFNTEHTLAYHETVYEMRVQGNAEAKYRASLIWTRLYELFNCDDSDDTDSKINVDIELASRRAEVPAQLERIVHETRFHGLSEEMSEQMRTSMKNIGDYGGLFSHVRYIDQLCLVFWQVDRILKEIEQIEGFFYFLN